jgi:peptidoglycan/LPS O-acetylase OafA/YrhL
MIHHRPEIDGLRAVAVLPVILYHAGFSGFSGGFVGVDVFFVISGYLITSIIHGDLERGRFSLRRFLERRARRILPALFLVVLVTSGFAWAWMLPQQLESYSWSVLSVLGFASNFYFWQSIDYFAAPAEFLPLLHTWSLAVEEQFYIFFPPLMMLMAWLGLSRGRMLGVLAAGALASLALCLWAVDRSPSANFFFPVTRAWELLAGSCLALVQSRQPLRGNNLLGALGLALIAGAVVGFGPATPFPSLWAVIPVTGTLLVLGFAQRGTWVARLLAMRGPVAIGLISYGAYLWHQPVFALARLRLPDHPGPVTMAALAVLSLLLAALSWWLLENPIRRGTGWAGGHGRRLALGAIGTVVVLGTGAAGGVLSGGVPQRFTPAQQAILIDANNFERLLEEHDRRKCFLDGRERVRLLEENGCLAPRDASDLVLYGNSHAAHLVFGLDALIGGHGKGAVHMFAAGSCRPWITDGTTRRCIEAHRSFLDHMQKAPPLRVVIAANWHAPYWELGEGVFEARIRDLTKTLTEMGHHVTLVGRVPQIAGRGWQAAVARLPEVPRDLALPSEDIAPVNALLAGIAADLGAGFADPAAVLCPAGLAACQVIANGTVLYSDGGHLSVMGSEMVATEILRVAGRKDEP